MPLPKRHKSNLPENFLPPAAYEAYQGIRSMRQPISGLPDYFQNSDLFKYELKILRDFCEKLSRKLGKKLSILEIGCEQGFFSLALAQDGHKLVCTDTSHENLIFVNELALLHGVQANLTTFRGEYNDIFENKEMEFDLVLMLGGSDYLNLNYSTTQIEILLGNISTRSKIFIFEYPIIEPGAFWSISIPKNNDWIFKHFKNFFEIDLVKKHNRGLSRPLLILTNNLILANGNFYDEKEYHNVVRHDFAKHLPNRRNSYITAGVITKIELGEIGIKTELSREAEILLRMEQENFTHLSFPKLQDFKQGIWVTQLTRESFSGQRLDLGWPADQSALILKSFIDLCARWSKAKLFHNDIRPWNLIWNGTELALIDYSAVDKFDKDANGLPQILSFLLVANYLAAGPSSISSFNIVEVIEKFYHHEKINDLNRESLYNNSWLIFHKKIVDVKSIDYASKSKSFDEIISIFLGPR